MSEASEGYEKLSGQFEILSSKIDLLNEKLELYKNISDEQIKSIRDEGKVYQDSIRSEIKAYQDANKQQLNVSLGVLVTAAIAILVSVIIGR
jgi:CHASE3 domain sensor protein